MLDAPKPKHKKWYVLVTKPKAEKQVSKRLSEINIENYLPLHRQLRIWHDRKKWIDTPLFHSYLFVFIEEKQRSKVFEAGGILKYVSIAGKISILNESEIERIKTLCSYLGDIEIEKENFVKGDEVQIITGHFAGIRGQITSIGDKYQFRIAIPGLCSAATVIIDKEQVLKIQ